ncbi:MAG: hypothetical protein JST01_08965 [Cyanobacteria bacterium SZAS TMP-1]|nr:hypothetical protein [Cyanobacteria bacterium SZAS TMP-1]
MTSDGTNSFTWDAENRLTQITYPGSGNNTQLTYDGYSGLVKIVETVSSSVTSTKQFVRCGSKICEERNAANALVKQFFGRGQTISATNYFYTKEHIGSVRDMTDSSGNVQAHFEYDMWGVQTKTTGALDADFGYAGYYAHARSGLYLTMYRIYSPLLGRWLSRDPIEEDGGNNLYVYVSNMPISEIDPLGLWQPSIPGTNFCGAGKSSGHKGSYGSGHWGEDDPLMPMPGSPDWQDPVKGPLHAVDTCCMEHDLCMHEGHMMPNPSDRKKKRCECDRELSKCLAAAGFKSPLSSPLSIPLSGGFLVKSFFRGPSTYTGR